MSEYKDQLLDSRWLRKRQIILKRDKYICTVCGSNKNLRVHHTYYLKTKTAPWMYPNKSLLTVCNDCHEKYHKEHELTLRTNHQKVKKKKKVINSKPKKPLSLKELYKIWEPKLKSKKCKLIKYR